MVLSAGRDAQPQADKSSPGCLPHGVVIALRRWVSAVGSSLKGEWGGQCLETSGSCVTDPQCLSEQHELIQNRSKYGKNQKWGLAYPVLFLKHVYLISRAIVVAVFIYYYHTRGLVHCECVRGWGGSPSA